MSFDTLMALANTNLSGGGTRKFRTPAALQGLGERLNLSADMAPTDLSAVMPQVVNVQPVARRLYDQWGGSVPFRECVAAAQSAIAQFQNFMTNNTAFSGPQAWEAVTMGRPGAGPEAYTRGIPQPMGLGRTTVAAGATGTLTVTAAKPVTADRLVITGTTAAGTQLAHLFVTRVDIGGNTYLNGSNAVPLEVFKNVDALRNFAGVVIQTSQTVTVDLLNVGTDPSLMSGSIYGFAGTP